MPRLSLASPTPVMAVPVQASAAVAAKAAQAVLELSSSPSAPTNGFPALANPFAAAEGEDGGEDADDEGGGDEGATPSVIFDPEHSAHAAKTNRNVCCSAGPTPSMDAERFLCNGCGHVVSSHDCADCGKPFDAHFDGTSARPDHVFRPSVFFNPNKRSECCGRDSCMLAATTCMRGLLAFHDDALPRVLPVAIRNNSRHRHINPSDVPARTRPNKKKYELLCASRVRREVLRHTGIPLDKHEDGPNGEPPTATNTLPNLVPDESEVARFANRRRGSTTGAPFATNSSTGQPVATMKKRYAFVTEMYFFFCRMLELLPSVCTMSPVALGHKKETEEERRKRNNETEAERHQRKRERRKELRRLKRESGAGNKRKLTDNIRKGEVVRDVWNRMVAAFLCSTSKSQALKSALRDLVAKYPQLERPREQGVDCATVVRDLFSTFVAMHNDACNTLTPMQERLPFEEWAMCSGMRQVVHTKMSKLARMLDTVNWPLLGDRAEPFFVSESEDPGLGGDQSADFRARFQAHCKANRGAMLVPVVHSGGNSAAGTRPVYYLANCTADSSFNLGTVTERINGMAQHTAEMESILTSMRRQFVALATAQARRAAPDSGMSTPVTNNASRSRSRIFRDGQDGQDGRDGRDGQEENGASANPTRMTAQRAALSVLTNLGSPAFGSAPASPAGLRMRTPNTFNRFFGGGSAPNSLDLGSINMGQNDGSGGGSGGRKNGRSRSAVAWTESPMSALLRATTANAASASSSPMLPPPLPPPQRKRTRASMLAGRGSGGGGAAKPMQQSITRFFENGGSSSGGSGSGRDHTGWGTLDPARLSTMPVPQPIC